MIDTSCIEHSDGMLSGISGGLLMQVRLIFFL